MSIGTPPELPESKIAQRVVETCKNAGTGVFLAESCTGGLIAAAITECPGASQVLLGGIVTYSNAAKVRLLRVPEKLITTHGAVSEIVCKAMAMGAMKLHPPSDVTLAVTGIAGPGGATPTKPIGLVHIALVARDIGNVPVVRRHEEFNFPKISRRSIRSEAVDASLHMLWSWVNSEAG